MAEGFYSPRNEPCNWRMQQLSFNEALAIVANLQRLCPPAIFGPMRVESVDAEDLNDSVLLQFTGVLDQMMITTETAVEFEGLSITEPKKEVTRETGGSPCVEAVPTIRATLSTESDSSDEDEYFSASSGSSSGSNGSVKSGPKAEEVNNERPSTSAFGVGSKNGS